MPHVSSPACLVTSLSLLHWEMSRSDKKHHLFSTNNTILFHLYHSAPCVVLPVCPQFFPGYPSLVSQSCLFLLWWWLSLNVLLSSCFLWFCYRFVLHKTNTVHCRQREQCSRQEQGYCSCSILEASCMFLPALAGVTQMQLGFQEEKSTLESLHFFCDLDLVLLLLCHCIGCLFLNVADLQLPFCVSWWLLCERLSSSSKQDSVVLELLLSSGSREAMRRE